MPMPNMLCRWRNMICDKPAIWCGEPSHTQPTCYITWQGVVVADAECIHRDGLHLKCWRGPRARTGTSRATRSTKTRTYIINQTDMRHVVGKCPFLLTFLRMVGEVILASFLVPMHSQKSLVLCQNRLLDGIILLFCAYDLQYLLPI